MWTGKPELEFSLRILLVPWSWQSLFSNPQVLHIFHRAVVNPQGHSSSECLTPMLFSLTASSRELSWHPHPKWRNELDLIHLITQASGKFTLQVRTPKPLQLQWLEIVHLSVGHGLMPFAIIWQKQKLSSKALAGEQKGCLCFFPQHFVFKCNCLFAVFLSLHNLFFDLGSQTVCYCFTALKISFKKRNQGAVTGCKHYSSQYLQALQVEELRFVFRTLTRRPGSAWALLGMGRLLQIRVSSKCEIFTACYLRKETPTSQADVFQSRSEKLHIVGFAWKVQSNVRII